MTSAPADAHPSATHRGAEIRTPDLSDPNGARYQAAPHPERAKGSDNRPMAQRDEIIRYANELLEIHRFPEYGRPGLQVLGADEVTKIACGVSSSLELFERAAAAGAQLVIVHHGMFWRNEPVWIDRRQRGRLQALFAADLNLAAYHLALDAHPRSATTPCSPTPSGWRSSGRSARSAREAACPSRPASTSSSAASARRWRSRAARLRARAGADRARRDLLGRRRRQADPGGARGLRPTAHGRAGGAEPAELTRARNPLRRGRSRRDRAARRAGARARLAERFGLEWEFLAIENPV